MPGRSWAAADPWYASVTFLTAATLIVTAIGTVAAWVGVYLSTPRRRLLLGIRTATTVEPPQLMTELTILDGGTPLTSPWFVEVELVGRGRRDIRSEDFDGQPLRLALGGRIVRVLEVRSKDTTRDVPTVTEDGAELFVGPSGIGKRQHVVITLLTDGPRPQLSQRASFSDVDVQLATTDELSRSRSSRILRILTTVLIGFVLAIAVLLATPGGRGYAFGVDKPIELRPLCEHLGGIVAPPAEDNAAFHYRCARSVGPITRLQIERRCKDQWGADAELVLRDPDSASGWKCHRRGLLK